VRKEGREGQGRGGSKEGQGKRNGSYFRVTHSAILVTTSFSMPLNPWYAIAGRIALAPASFKGKQFFAPNGDQFVHDLGEVAIFAVLAPVLFVMNDEGSEPGFFPKAFSETGRLLVSARMV